MSASIYYMMLLKDQDHAAIVAKIIDDSCNIDNGTEEDFLANFNKLEVIRTLGEDEIYNKFISELKEDDRYKDYIICE
ncbi:hypothetical protein CU633_22235 [Bacillus sp. V3-13]|uniref:hypothetical protein n=1 Tax=Bacillus sp. V3-13 TaxID=2053728 RepID=UPI000C75F8C5|nr:hypothetical protein [Bacillus sp. V3-13]PLR75212.1 hypothetical protein CU633_22235 [Bacillus sp. V3-13]